MSEVVAPKLAWVSRRAAALAEAAPALALARVTVAAWGWPSRYQTEVPRVRVMVSSPSLSTSARGCTSTHTSRTPGSRVMLPLVDNV
jgi:hypothetical protein